MRIAFIGPWNYSSGLGAGARSYISALWQTGHSINLHPVHSPFHVHARQTLANDVRSFTGPADIVIVNINPDGWATFLTPEQREIISSAGVRIGVFVWEMSRVPDSWVECLGALDAVWTPSNFCAEALRGLCSCPVHVIPHVVPIPPPPALQSAQEFAPEGRRIFYAFDGASMLARKRPTALTEAFAASGLAARGWHLLLKTKNLQDSGAAGATLASAVASPSVTLLSASLKDDEMVALMQAADIYASPHCSEGFGLTIAEAMAHGKLVVATDYGGSRDFLDDTCGFPVGWTEVALTEDAGPYPKGGVWAEVDVPAFTEALLQAAAAVEAGDTALGRNAQARIASSLSAEVVAERMNASFAGILAESGAC